MSYSDMILMAFDHLVVVLMDDIKQTYLEYVGPRVQNRRMDDFHVDSRRFTA